MAELGEQDGKPMIVPEPIKAPPITAPMTAPVKTPAPARQPVPVRRE